MNNYIGRIVYNKFYGKGTIIDYIPATKENSDSRLIIKFDSETSTKKYEEHTIGEVLFFDIPQYLIDRQNKERIDEYKKELEYEQSFLSSIYQKCKDELQNIEDNTFVNINSDFENIDDTISSDNPSKNTIKSRINSFMHDPYFAKIIYDGKTYYFSKKDDYGDNIISTNNKQLYGKYINRKIELSNPDHKYSLIRDFIMLSPKVIELIDTNLPYAKNNNNFIDYEVEFEKQQIKVIERQRSIKAVKDIIQTIDREQYEIISNDQGKHILVQGVAGSGKSYIISKRISYLFANDLDITSKKVTIITPTILLGNDLKSLIREWGLEDINIVTYKKYLIDNYNEYFERLNLKDINNFDPKDLHSSSDYRIYSNKNIKRFLELVEQITQKNLKSYMYRKFIEEYEKSLINKLNMYTSNPKFNLKDIIKYNQEYFELLDIVTYSINQLSYIEVLAITKNSNSSNEIKVFLEKLLKSKIKFEGKYTNFTAKGEVNTQSYSRELTEVLDLFRVGQLPSFEWKKREDLKQALIQFKNKANDNEVQSIGLSLDEIPTLLNNFFTSDYEIKEQKIGVMEEVQRLISRRNTRNLIPEYLTRVHEKKLVNDLFTEFYLNSFDVVSAMNDYLTFKEKDEFKNILPQIIKFILIQNKQQFRQNQALKYDFEVLYYLYALNKYYGFNSTERVILFIDEYQNLSASEINIGRMITKNVELNLYGDKNQSTTDKELFDVSNEINTWQFFQISKNYRNARKIVDYINKTLDQSIESIDIPGNVTEITSLSQVELNSTNDDQEDIGDRIAIIVKDFSLVNADELKSTGISYKYLEQEDFEIERNIFNIMKPDLIKGLEFEIVIAYDEGLTHNERYITYSRALKNLYVIK